MKMGLYLCDFCSLKARTTSQLKDHIERVHLGWRHTCEICGTQFNCKDSLVHHTRTVHEKRFLYCDKCDYKTGLTQALTEHIQVVHMEVRHGCTFCNHQAKSKSGLIKHVNRKHYNISYECEICENVKFFKKIELWKHNIEVHKLGEKFSCNHCEQIFSKEYNLRYHIQKNHPQVQLYQQIEQEQLNKILSSNEQHRLAAAPELVYQPTEQPPTFCPDCDYQTAVEEELTSHRKSRHIYPCHLCRFESHDRQEMRDHLDKCHRKPQVVTIS